MCHGHIISPQLVMKQAVTSEGNPRPFTWNVVTLCLQLEGFVASWNLRVV